MAKEEIKKEIKREECCPEQHHRRKHYIHRGTDVVYGLGFIGACIYFLSIAPTFWFGVLGVLKGIVWPVFFVLESFKVFGL